MRDYLRHGRLVRRFRPEEDAELEERRIAGATLDKIAAELGRAKSSVQLRLGTLARRAEEAEERGYGCEGPR